MALVTTSTPVGFILSNDEWTDDFLTGIAALEDARGTKMSYNEKQAQWLLYSVSGNASSVAWDDITGRPDLSRVQLFTFQIGTAPSTDTTVDETFANGSVFQSDLLIGAHLQIRVSNSGLAPQTGGYTYVPSTGTITTASAVNDSNMFILAVFDIDGSSSDGPTEFTSEFTNEFL